MGQRAQVDPTLTGARLLLGYSLLLCDQLLQRDRVLLTVWIGSLVVQVRLVGLVLGRRHLNRTLIWSIFAKSGLVALPQLPLLLLLLFQKAVNGSLRLQPQP